MLIDYHVHTNYSVDASMTVQEVCKRAVELGFSEICFTNHQEWETVANETYDFALTDAQWNEHISEIQKARETYPLKVKFGAEVSFYPGWKAEILQFTRQYPFDYIIGDLHWYKGLLLADLGTKMPKVASPIDVFRGYFREINKIIQLGYFDCVGHMDLPKKQFGSIPLSDYIDEVKECIESMKKNDIGFELNTMGWSLHHKECYPSEEILKLMHDAGIRKVTIGSDSHDIDMFGFRIKEGIALLKKTGFSEICTFTQRKPEYHKI